MRNLSRNEDEKSYYNWHTKMQSRIDKDIMTPVYTVGWIFIDREKWVTEILRYSEETIWTISEEEMPRVVHQPCHTRFPEVPPCNKSFHLLHLENITTVFLPE